MRKSLLAMGLLVLIDHEEIAAVIVRVRGG